MVRKKMVIKEGSRALSYLSLYGYPVDAVMVNRILPGIESDGKGNAQLTTPSNDPYLRGLQEIQVNYLSEIEREFYPLPTFRASWSDKEMVGLGRLHALATEVYGDRDPGLIYFRGQAPQIIEEGNDFILKLPLPNVELDKVRLTKRGDELFISIGNFKRELLLPTVLAQRSASGAVFNDGVLKVRFPPAA